MQGVLTSRNFIYLVEGEPAVRGTPERFGTRFSSLSYFLWSSMPDEGLFAAVKDGKIEWRRVEERGGSDVADSKTDRTLTTLLVNGCSCTVWACSLR